MNFAIDVEEINKLTGELVTLRDQVTALQERNTRVRERLLEVSIRANVLHFHRVMGQPVLDEPQVPPEDRVRMRLRLIAEEFFELFYAVTAIESVWALGLLDYFQQQLRGLINCAELKVDLPALADALCDLDYVVEGTRLEFGIDGGPVLAEVQRANIAKVGGVKRADGKIQKPEGWQAPDIASVLRSQGWRK